MVAVAIIFKAEAATIRSACADGWRVNIEPTTWR